MEGKPTEEEMQEIKECFGLFDQDRKGKISVKEFGTAIRALGLNPSEAEITEMIKQADKKGSGFVDYKTFLTLVTKNWKKTNTADDIVDAFKVMDRESTGYINAKDLKHVMTNLGEKLTDEEMEDLLKEADLDSDGQLNYTQLSRMLLSK